MALLPLPCVTAFGCMHYNNNNNNNYYYYNNNNNNFINGRMRKLIKGQGIKFYYNENEKAKLLLIGIL